MSTPQTEIRQAGPADLAQIGHCARAAYARYLTRMSRTPAPMVADFEALVTQGVVWVAVEQDTLAGFVVYYPNDTVMHLENVAVSPSHRGRGFGGALIRHVEQAALAAGLTAVELYTNAAMTENLTLYPALGYQITDQRREAGFDRVYFRKTLSQATVKTQVFPSNESREQQRVRSQLLRSGLNLFACLELSAVHQHGVTGLPSPDQRPHASLVLIGNGGPALWSACQRSAFRAHADPVDAFSMAAVTDAFATHAPERNFTFLYPVPDCTVALQQLGALAGWHQPSPLGMGIHADWGLWFAYRALILLDVAWPATPPQPATLDICAACESQACVSACPGAALSSDQPPDLRACADYRVFGKTGDASADSSGVEIPDSSGACAKTCLARSACPVAPEQRYSVLQMEHHYSRSLGALQRWINPKSV